MGLPRCWTRILCCLALALLASCNMATASPAWYGVPSDGRLVFNGGDKVTWFGDSITQGSYSTPYFQGFTDAAGAHLTNVDRGHNGASAADLQTYVATEIAGSGSNVVVIEVGVNDVVLGFTPGQFATNLSTLVSMIRSALPSVRLGYVNIFCYGEGATWDTSATTIAAFNAAALVVCQTSGVTYFDVRSPELAWQAANNPPPGDVGVGLLTVNNPPGPQGVHPSALGISAIYTPVLAAQSRTTW